MTIFFFFLGVLQCVFIWLLYRGGLGLRDRAQKERSAILDLKLAWPRCAMIIPVSGEHPDMANALRSLLEQDYPAYDVFIVTAGNDEPALALVDQLMDEYGNLTHITAGRAENCGQKNWNLLAGVAAAASVNPDIYVFCDSTHLADKVFLRCLILPIAQGETAFSTGYHEVVPRDNGIVTLAYAMTVLFMRLLQGLAVFTQPWGGAMAMTRDAFDRYKIAELWRENVVDDCSLAAMLQKRGVHVKLCAAALLETNAREHSRKIWRAWLERQIKFLKFCMPGQWVALGFLCLFMIVPPVWCLVAVLDGLFNIGTATAPFLALCWFFLLAWAIWKWRALLPAKIAPWRWFGSFFGAICMFAFVYLDTIASHTMVWHNIIYHVGKGGRVKSIERS